MNQPTETGCGVPSCPPGACRHLYGLVPLRAADTLPGRYLDARSDTERDRWWAWLDRWLARR